MTLKPARTLSCPCCAEPCLPHGMLGRSRWPPSWHAPLQQWVEPAQGSLGQLRASGRRWESPRLKINTTLIHLWGKSSSEGHVGLSQLINVVLRWQWNQASLGSALVHCSQRLNLLKKNNILSSFTHPRVVLNLYDFSSIVENKEIFFCPYYKSEWSSFFIYIYLIDSYCNGKNQWDIPQNIFFSTEERKSGMIGRVSIWWKF